MLFDSIKSAENVRLIRPIKRLIAVRVGFPLMST
jgi:hypothetical protein